MPEQPPSKREPTWGTFSTCPPEPHRYAELHCRSNFSFLDGASHPDELITRATELGLTALAITDRNSLAGIVRAHVAAKESKLKLLIGAEITPVDAPPVVLWVMNRAGYANLCRLITRGRRNAPKGECRLTFADVAEHAADLLAGVVLERPPAADHAPRDEPNLRTTSIKSSTSTASTARHAERDGYVERLRTAFGDRAYAIAELHRGPEDRQRLQDADLGGYCGTSGVTNCISGKFAADQNGIGQLVFELIIFDARLGNRAFGFKEPLTMAGLNRGHCRIIGTGIANGSVKQASSASLFCKCE